MLTSAIFPSVLWTPPALLPADLRDRPRLPSVLPVSSYAWRVPETAGTGLFRHLADPAIGVQPYADSISGDGPCADSFFRACSCSPRAPCPPKRRPPSATLPAASCE